MIFEYRYGAAMYMAAFALFFAVNEEKSFRWEMDMVEYTQKQEVVP